MSFFSSLKNAFGFGGEIDDDTTLDDEASSHRDEPQSDNSASDNSASAQRQNTNAATEATSDAKLDTNLAGDIFSGVLEVFNSALPEFLRNSVDYDKQREQLVKQLDVKLSQRIAAVLESARKQGLSEIADERLRTNEELKRIRDLNKTLDERQRETNAAKLSAERQKRALKDRVGDLESQIAALEAEKEQYQLETKSMLNRLRAAGVAGTDAAATLLPDPETERNAKELAEKLEASKSEIIRINAESTDRLRQIEQINAQRVSLTAENEKLRNSIDQLKAKQEVSDAMINSLQSKASEALKQADDLRAQIGENTITAEQVNEIEKQLEQFGEVKNKYEERIKSLKKDVQTLNETIVSKESLIKERDATIASLQEDVNSLKKTINDNLKDHSAAMAALNAELEEAKKSASSTSAPDATHGLSTTSDTVEAYDKAQHDAQSERKRRRKANPRLSAIEKSIENNDWFGAPTENETLPKTSSDNSDDDFGYKTPQRKTIPDNTEQMSLW